jgi:hypothetical protein
VVGCSGVKNTSIDYAHGFDFGTIETFHYVDSPESNIQDNPLMADRVVNLIKKELGEAGLQEVEENPDLFVTYHFASEERRSFNTTSTGYGGYGGYWDDWGGWGPYDAFGGPMMTSSTTREYVYEEGTLVIDAYDPVEKKLVWRGMGTVNIKDKPDKQVQQVEQILASIGDKWDKIVAGQGT